MKKLFLLALALGFFACSKEDNSEKVAASSKQIFNPNPTPADYNSQDFFIKYISLPTKKNAKTAKLVSVFMPDLELRKCLYKRGLVSPLPSSDISYPYVIFDDAINIGGLDLSDVDCAKITNLKGLESFINLVQLTIKGTQLQSLAISNFPNLVYLDCSYNSELTTVIASTSAKVQQIYTNNCPKLSNLYLPYNSTTLWGIWCYNCNLATLNLNNNTKITQLFCQSNKLTTLNLTPYVNLTQVNLSANLVPSFNLNFCPKLISVWCYSSTALTDLYLKNGKNALIVNQDFRYNAKNPLIHIDNGFNPIVWKATYPSRFTYLP